MTTLKRVLQFGHSLLEEVVKYGDTVIDATVGNGHDTVFLARLVGDNGKVYGFDIQPQAIDNTRAQLEEYGMLDRVELILESHDRIRETIQAKHLEKITGAIFNLGYLPGGDKQIVTTPQSTINAVEQLLAMMVAGGMIVIVVYHGHPEGQIERDNLLQYVSMLDQKKVHVLEYKFLNQKNNAPFVIALEKVK